MVAVLRGSGYNPDDSAPARLVRPRTPARRHDGAPTAERLSLFATETKGPTDESEPCLDPTALTAGIVVAIFAQIRYHIEVETEAEEEAIATESFLRCRSRPLREMVLATADQVGIDRGPLRAESGSDALVMWSDSIDQLRDRIPWDDRDYLAGDVSLDLDLRSATP